MLKKMNALDFGADYAFSPPDREVLINTDEIVTVVQLQRGSHRRSVEEDLMQVKMKDGKILIVLGVIDDLLK